MMLDGDHRHSPLEDIHVRPADIVHARAGGVARSSVLVEVKHH